jgi:hypothetical protein
MNDGNQRPKDEFATYGAHYDGDRALITGGKKWLPQNP